MTKTFVRTPVFQTPDLFCLLLVVYFSWFDLLLLCLLCLVVLCKILALWPPAPQYQIHAQLFVCVLFILFMLFIVVLSGEPRQNQGRALVDRKLV